MRTLDVLLAGSVLPPNPAELLESRTMDTILARARSVYDLVVIDTAPLAVVSDTFPLLTKVDGVVVVGWVGHSRRDAAKKLEQVLHGSGAPLLGVIASGARSDGLGSYAVSGGGPASPPTDSSGGASSSEQLVSTAKF
jgi:Mrp family chromosome partitioning ATPase